MQYLFILLALFFLLRIANKSHFYALKSDFFLFGTCLALFYHLSKKCCFCSSFFKTIRLSHLLYQSRNPLGVVFSGYQRANNITSNLLSLHFFPSFWIHLRKLSGTPRIQNNLLLLLLTKSSGVLFCDVVRIPTGLGQWFFASFNVFRSFQHS